MSHATPVFFEDRSFVVHRVTGDNFIGRCSAWCESNGDIRDIERFNQPIGGRPLPVAKGGHIWKAVQGTCHRIAAEAAKGGCKRLCH